MKPAGDYRAAPSNTGRGARAKALKAAREATGMSEAFPASQRIAHEDDIKPVGLRTARRHRIVRALEANGLVAKRRQHLLLPQKARVPPASP